MIEPEVAERLKRSNDWQHVMGHIQEEILKLDSIDDIDFTKKEEACIKAEGRKAAREILINILEPFFSLEQPSANKQAETKKKTGLV